MTERDFDNIFRRKIEQIPDNQADMQVWENINAQLDNGNNKGFAWKTALAVLLILSLLGNYYLLMNKVNDKKMEVRNQYIVNDTITNRIVINRYDTTVHQVNVYSKKVIETPVFQQKNTNFSNTINLNENKISTKNNIFTNEITTSNVVISNEKNIDKTIANTVSNIEIPNEKIENSNENITENEALNTEKIVLVDEKKTMINEDSILSGLTDDKNISLKLKSQNTDNEVVKEEKVEDKIIQIKPKRERKLSDWSVGISSLNSVMLNEKGEGSANGLGISVATNLNRKWRISSNFDFQEYEFFNKDNDRFPHGHNPSFLDKDSTKSWKIRQTPYTLLTLGIDRIFRYKKLETFVGIASGVNFVFPQQVVYETRKFQTTKPNYLKEDIDLKYKTFSGVQFQVGASYPIYKKFNIMLSAQYQHNTNKEKLIWENQIGIKAGVKYVF